MPINVFNDSEEQAASMLATNSSISGADSALLFNVVSKSEIVVADTESFVGAVLNLTVSSFKLTCAQTL